MRKRIALCMVALVLTLLGPGMALVVSRSFALTMERERARALGEEAAIARALTLETAEGNVGRSTASTLQTRYGSNELTIYLLQNGETITGEALPTVQKLPELLNTETRATLLDGVSERLLIAHALDGEITLLTALDVSPVYALRRELLRGAAALGLIGLALAGALAIWISGVLTRPLSQLADAAAKLADGDYAAPLPAAKNDEMNALIRAFSRMSAAIDERETALRTQAEERQALIDALAHEMRTPLAVMKLAVQGLQEDEDSRLSDFAKESVNMLQSESERLSRLTENLMTLARSDENILPVYTAQVDITALCKKVASQMSLLAAEKKLQLKQEIQDNLVMQGDEMALSRLLIILLDNAMKYSSEQTQITLRVAKVKTHLVLEVRDEGCGISDDDKQKIFDRFFRVDKARSRSQGGLGLGLSLALAIVRQHGGSIKVLDNKPRGTIMYVKLPTTVK